MSIRSEYKRARKNAQARYRRLVNQGFYFDENPIPAIPKRITEGSIRRLNKLTAKELREQATSAFSIETGELTTPKEAYKERRRQTYRRQSEAQKHAYKMRQFDEYHAENVLQRRREKGEKFRDFIEEARQREEYDLEQELLAQAEVEFRRDAERKAEDYYYDYTEDDFEQEIQNAYESGEYEDARELEAERDKRYAPDEEDIAELTYEDRYWDAVEIVKQYSPEIAERLLNSFYEYMERSGGESFETGLTGQRLKDFEEALSNLEDTRYRADDRAWWGIYTKLDKAINNRTHSTAEKRAFFAMLQSGDFNYE